MTTNDQAWRPQAFGRRNAKQIVEPIVEPMWRGDRVIAVVAEDSVELFNAEGEPLRDPDDELAAVIAAVMAASRAGHIVVDGYLTRQALPDNLQPYLSGSEVPTAGELTSQMLVGRGLRTRRLEHLEKTAEPEGRLAFVAVDLLSLDGQPLLDIPLLERKRLLESVLAEAHTVRCSAFVRPPIDTWLASWRSLGFSELAFKGANSRYEPGAIGDDWAIARIPTN